MLQIKSLLNIKYEVSLNNIHPLFKTNLLKLLFLKINILTSFITTILEIYVFRVLIFKEICLIRMINNY